MSDFKDPTWFGLDAFFNWLKDNRINDPTKTGDFDTADYWHQAMDYTVGFDHLVRVTMGDDEYARFKWLVSDAPLVGNLARLADSINYWNDYFKNTGLSWSDVLYPTRLSGTGSGGYASLNFISDNIKKLYG